ncbi:hypothetical protein EXU48_13580 [Occultella glacieicola]|uniref:Uncharacterized protein n=1 Tax=Occultella glacieicola TaxID=2518684 RepID=A0ABY2E575_9MICO|nr:hypothetical protein [Occultella glacieicola]TDE92572.1 hypothetical protein EXU48_13580 [Occultella glacieicola]
MTDRDHRPDGRAGDRAAAEATENEPGTAYPASPPPSGVHRAPSANSGDASSARPEEHRAPGTSPWGDYASSPYPVNPEADAPDHTLADPAYRPPDYAREPTPAHGVGTHYPPSPSPGSSWYSARSEPDDPPGADGRDDGAEDDHDR